MRPARKAYPDCDATLTREEREAAFAMPDPDIEPVAGPTRTAIVWDGRFEFEEIDPATGRVVARGSVAALVKLTHADREELRP